MLPFFVCAIRPMPTRNARVMLGIRARRLLAAASGPLGFALLTLGASVLGLSLHDDSAAQNNTSLSHVWPFLTGGVIIGVLFWIYQAYSEYKRQTFDPQLAIQYDLRWKGAEDIRKVAAARLLERRTQDSLTLLNDRPEELADIDDALDIIEDVGAFVANEQMSPEVAHHFFFHTARGYWNAARPYIEAMRDTQPALWRNLPILMNLTGAIESEQSGAARSDDPTILTGPEILTFLEEEKAGLRHVQ
jgi:hypothetical protein